MAAESGGLAEDMVSVEEQPIDLSKVPKKPMPSLIPISLLRSGLHPCLPQEPPVKQLPRLHPIHDEREEEGARKRVRGCHKLDRARSVPQLTPLTATLQRNKSLSESRIPAASAAPAAPQCRDTDERMQAAIELLNRRPPSQMNDELLQSSWIYIGYYSQLLHRFQAQEMLRQFALHSERDSPSDEQLQSLEGPTGGGDDSADTRRRQTRPLTGKHVRTGTGASPATLLTLRRKIQARRQRQHDPHTSSRTGD